jgi:hypothetical protein
MTIFAILMPSPQPALAQAIRNEFPNDHLMVTETQWLISTGGTVIDLSKKLGVADSANLNAPAVGVGIIFATSSYFGRAPQTVWDWLRVKLEPVSRAG